MLQTHVVFDVLYFFGNDVNLFFVVS
jgi:hypothetical protein